MTDDIIGADELKFCPVCGHEGHDETCPVCNEKMASIDAEVEKLAEKENEDDLLDDAGLGDVSLEEVASKENNEDEKLEDI
jgi:hypothetical protein